MKKLFYKKHVWIIFAYFFIYMAAFQFLETRSVSRIHIIHTALDDRIPFCEYFIIPYFLWFLYSAGTVIYFAFFNKNVREYWQLILSLGLGLTLFLLVSWCYPNGHNLRPLLSADGNIFTEMVRFLYRIDTPTNILPSMHVFVSLAAAVAIDRCQALKKHWIIRKASWVLAILIVLSTLFLKQHSTFDAFCGIALYTFLYLLIYGKEAYSMQSVPARRSL